MLTALVVCLQHGRKDTKTSLRRPSAHHRPSKSGYSQLSSSAYNTDEKTLKPARGGSPPAAKQALCQMCGISPTVIQRGKRSAPRRNPTKRSSTDFVWGISHLRFDMTARSPQHSTQNQKQSLCTLQRLSFSYSVVSVAPIRSPVGANLRCVRLFYTLSITAIVRLLFFYTTPSSISFIGVFSF